MQQIWIGSLLLLTAVSGCATRGESVNNKEEIKPLPVTRLIATDTVLHRFYVADIEAVQNVEIRARVNGFLDKIHVDEGQRVHKGQLLFSLNDTEFQAELARAKAALSSAEAEAKAAELELERVKLLVEKKVIATSELAVAQAKLAAIRARIDEARSAVSNASTRLSYTSIRAPFDGIIDRIPLKTGSLVSEGALLTSVSDIREVYAYFNVSETEYLEYNRSRDHNSAKAPETVKLILADGTEYRYPGKVETIESEFEENTGSIAFRARFPNPQQLLKHGASGQVCLTNTLDSALMLPQKAVFELQDKNFVFVVDSTNVVKMHAFVPKTRIDHFYIVQSGLQPGQRIVYEGVRNIREGMRIDPRPVKLDSLLRL